MPRLKGFARSPRPPRFQGGYEAVQLRVAEQYIGKFGELAKSSNTLVLPATVSDVGLDDRTGHERDRPPTLIHVAEKVNANPRLIR